MLLVDGYATYFAGSQALLVHDDYSLEDISVLLPGLTALRGR